MTKIPVRKRKPRSEELIDETIDESFPASDPPSYSRTARSGAPRREGGTPEDNPGKKDDSQ